MPEKSTPSSVGPHRRLDARSLRALAHPLRMRILELIDHEGPFTSTGLAQRLGENTGTVSWHLRHLAEHDFLEEDTERGTKRERWWKSVEQSTELSPHEFADDPEARAAAAVYQHGLVEEFFNAVTVYLTEDWQGPWQGAGRISRDTSLRLTPDQLRALNAEISDVIARHTPDPGAEPGSGALPVVLQWQGFPRRERNGS